MLPVGQKARHDFPRFGLPRFANRFPANVDEQVVEVQIDNGNTSRIDLCASGLTRATIQTDFHCVTTWSFIGVEWSGVRFRDLFEQLTDSVSRENIVCAVFAAQDGYKTSLLREDMLADNVLIADSLDGHALPIKHGAPLRLVAPNHYGYKNLKHLKKITFYSETPVIKRGVSAFLDHPRARVRLEERARWVPGWLVRPLYQLLIQGTERKFRHAMQRYNDKND